jgi:hypothetical protein
MLSARETLQELLTWADTAEHCWAQLRHLPPHTKAGGDGFKNGSPPAPSPAHLMSVQRVERALGCSVYLLYWYKSTNADAARRPRSPRSSASSVYLLYRYKSTNTDAARTAALLSLVRLLASLVQKYKH